MMGAIPRPSRELVLESVSIAVKGYSAALIDNLSVSVAPGLIVTIMGRVARASRPCSPILQGSLIGMLLSLRGR
jgi:ABC-type protease/lipase transport system fused ATPase/permease subunit